MILLAPWILGLIIQAALWLCLDIVSALADDTITVRWSTVYVALEHDQVPAPMCPPMWAGSVVVSVARRELVSAG